MTFPRACAMSLLFLLLSTSVPVAHEAARPEGLLPPQVAESCVLSHGYWKTHYPWPVRAMALGDPAFSAHQYSAGQLLTLLDSPAKGDASTILATQLIAAKLNVANGANPSPVATALARADALLAAIRQRLPYGIKSNTPMGSDMVATAAILERYNTGQIAGSCGTANTAPVADAGPDQNVVLGALVTLDGSASSDADGNQLRYEWTFLSRPAGSVAELTNPAGVRPTFLADEPGTYQVQLLVYDGVVASEPAMVRISTENVRPIAHAGADQTAAVTATVHLDGAASTDVDGDPLTFAWRLLQRPASSQADLQNPAAVDPLLTIDAAGEYIVELVVSDGSLDSLPDTVRISTVNSAPVANAGPDATAVNGATITLDGSGSTDVDGDGLTYRWTLSAVPPGSAAVLAGVDTVGPSFVIDISGEYVAQLVVNDGTVDSSADTVVITTLNTRPVANAGADHALALGQFVELDGSGSTDVDGDALTYQWSFTTVPPGSAAALSDAAAVRPIFTPDVAGLYVAQLIVNDASSASDPDTATISVNDEPVNQPPVAEAGLPQTVGVGATVTLDGSLSSDPDGNPLTYQWSLTLPAGSTAVLSDATAAQPTFVADVPGNYVAQLVVNDGAADSAPDTVTISTENSAPVANAGSDRAVTPGTLVTLDGNASFDPDGTPLTYAWSLTRPAGSNAVLSSTTTADPSFVADIDGVYVAQLIVSDGTLSSAPDTVAISAGPGIDLSLTFWAAPSNPPVGVAADWGIQIFNFGSTLQPDVEVSMPVPSGYTFVSASASQGAYNPATGIWTLPTMSSGAHLTLRLMALATGTHDLAATVLSSSVPDTNPANNSAFAPATANPNVDLFMESFNFAPGTRNPGEEITIILDVRNRGPAAAADVVVEFRIPAGFTLNSAATDRGNYDSTTGLYTIGSLGQFELARITLRMRLNATGLIDLRAVASTTSPDVNPADNTLVIPRNNRIPVANAGADRATSTHALVTLDGSGSFDADGDPITFEWTSASRPINSDGTMTGPTTPSPSFTPDLPGDYVGRLIVRDNQGTVSVPDLITVAAVVTNTAPALVSTPITSAFTGQPYQYDVNAADVDTADVLQYSLPTAPAGMSVDPLTGLIQWLPNASQGGPAGVVVRVQDAAGLAATQSFTIQVSSPSNGAPIAADDAFSVRIGESLSVPAPGVTANDVDTSPLSVRLASPPGNGAVLLNTDGSFTYTPHTMQPGELVMAENVNLAARLPGVVVSNGGCPLCAIDENIYTEWNYAASTLVLTFPSDIRVSRVDVIGSRNAGKPKIAVARVVLESAAGATLYDSGSFEIPLPDRDGQLTIPGVPGVRRVRFIPDASSVFHSALAEIKVIGSGLMQRTPFVEPNLLQLLPVTTQASSVSGPHVAESVADDNESTNWFTGFSAGEFIEVTFPVPVTVRQLTAANPSGRPDGFGTSIEMSCSGTVTLLDANRGVLHDSGIVNGPTGGLHPSGTFTLNFPDVAGVRHIRYTSSGCTAGFGLGFSGWQVLGTAPVSTPAFGMSEKLQSLQGREAHSTPIVINLTDDNGDGSIDANDVPDIAVPVEANGNQLRGEIMVVSGDDGRLLFTAGGPDLVSPWSELAAADIDADGRPEIVAVSASGDRLLAFEHDGTLKWQSATNTMPSFFIGSSQVFTGAVSIANLDGTGPPEIIVGASVFDADGNLLGDGRTIAGTTGGTGMRSAMSAVGDIDLDGAPELVAGPTVYRLSGGSVTRVWQRNDRTDGYVALANLDDDPQAEIATVANGFVYVLNHDGSDFQPWNGPSHAPVALPGGGQGGAPLIVDVDGDGRPEIGVAGSASFVVFNRDGSVRWKASISDRSSNSTGAVAFDLNGDGEVEIIYRDERFLRVYRGADGVLLSKIPVGSATWSEEPVVADVDNDGHADIVVSSDLFAQSQNDTGVLVFQDVANRWNRTRRIWNQHAYHITNVDENGTIPTNESAHWLASGLNAFRTNAFVPGESTDASDSFTYIASDGTLESNAATVQIALRTPNAQPQFTSQPIVSAAPAVAYTYAAQAEDPDSGDILAFSLSAAPAGMSIDPQTGLIEWTPEAAQTGSHDVIVKVADLRGLFALQAYSIDVTAPLTVPSIVGQPSASAGSTITGAGFSVGEITSRHSASVAPNVVISQNPGAGTLAAAGSPVSYVVSLGPPPVGIVPAVIGLTQTNAVADVSAASLVATVAIRSSSLVPAGIVMAQNPAAGTVAEAGSIVALTVSTGPPPGELDLDGDGFTGDQGDCRDDDSLINPNAIDTPGDGIDQNCNGVDSIAGDTTVPVAAISSPAEDAEVTMPTAIIGTATDANFLRYRLLASSVDDDAFVEFASGTSPITDGALGTLDPTLRENGMYRVRLLVEDVNGHTTIDERIYRIDGEAKVGMLTLAFVDLRVPVSGIPITVVRTYDSRIKAQFDFGIGWELQVKSGRYQNNRKPGDGWQVEKASGPFGLPCSVTTETKSHVTEIRLSDRESYLFRPKLAGLAALVGGCVGRVEFELLSGTVPGARLEVIGNSDIIYTSGNQVEEFDGSAATGLVFDPAEVRLITRDGRQIDFRRTTGITRIQDSNDNTLTIGPSGISHSSGKSIVFTRDAKARITRVTDPLGRTLNYRYDTDDLVEFVDQGGNSTHFIYDTRHNLVEIVDALGNQALRSEYDADGRLIASTDGNGRRTEFTHNLAGQEDIVIDALGRPRRVTYDERGNILAHEQSVTIDGVAVLAQTTYAYDADGNETTVIDPDLRRRDTVWDAFANQVAVVVDPDGLGIRREATYNAEGHTLSETDPNGDSVQYVVDGKGNATAWTDVDGRVSTIEYDSAGQVTRFGDADGQTTHVAYDGAGRVLLRTDSLGRTTSYSYDSVGNRLTEVAPRTVDGVLQLLTTRFEYDQFNRVTRMVDPLGHSTTMRYDALGRLISRIDALGRATNFEYDALDALLRTQYPDGTTEVRQYDEVGNLVQVVDREGLTTQYQYDELRRRIAAVLPGGATARTIYSPGGQVMATIAPDGSRTDYEYDAAGRRTVTRLPAVVDGTTGATVRPEMRTEYDAGGRPTATIDARGNRTSVAYDVAARSMTATLPDGSTMSEFVDQWNRPVRRVDQEGQIVTFEYLADTGLLQRVTTPAPSPGAPPASWIFTYDEAGNRLTQTDPLGRSTRYHYDALGRPLRTVLPGGQIRSLAYDAIGRTTQFTDYDGAASTFEYDAADRLIRRTDANGQETTFAYTPGGRRAGVTDARGQTSYTYDSAGRLATVTQPDTGAVEYAYDVSNRVTSISTPGGSTGYGYDAAGRMTSVSTAGGSIAYSYDPNGNVNRLVLPNGITSTYAYDSRNQLTSLIAKRGIDTLASFGYSYTPVGRRSTITELGAATAFTYDGVGQLVQEIRTGAAPYARTYEYDRAGNRTRAESNGFSTTFTYDANDRLLTAGVLSFDYDAKGNVISRNSAGLITTFGWTPNNRLASITSGAQTSSFAYDVDGTRVSKTVGSSTTRYLVDGLNPTGLRQVLEERGDTGNLVRRFEYGGGLLSSTQGDATTFYEADGQLNVRLLSDESGGIVDEYGYDAFGNLVADTGNSDNAYLYGGQQLDEESGLYYLRERYYDPVVGRFLGLDPVAGDPFRPLSLHRYTYAGNDPANFADPNGDFFTLIGFSLTNVLSGLSRGAEFSGKGMQLCRISAFKKVAQLAVYLRSAAASSKAFATIAGAFSIGLSPNSLASVNPGLGGDLTVRLFQYEHPFSVAGIPVPPGKFHGEPEKIELTAKFPSTRDKMDLELAGKAYGFPQVTHTVGFNLTPRFAFRSFQSGVEVEREICTLSVCGLDLGKVAATFGAALSGGGSGLEGSLEVGIKVDAPFFPALKFALIKVPDDLQ